MPIAMLAGFVMVEVMNYNHLFRDLTFAQTALNLLWYAVAALILFLITGRRTMTAGAALALYLFIGLANRYVIRFRGRTIFPGDLTALTTAFNVAQNYDYSLDTLQLTCVLWFALFLALLWKLPRQKQRAYPRLPVTLVGIALPFAYAAVFFLTPIDAALGIEPSMWTTRGNGLVLNFMVCLKYSTVQEPEGYSQEALQEIVNETRDTFAPTAPADGTRPANIVVVMNESYSDLSSVADLPANEDWMPFYRSLTENTIKGTAYSSVFGGTTANSEYEFLTGNTTAFLPEGTVPFQMYVQDGSPSLVGQLKSLGYSALAMHPYLSSGWNRIPVYRDFGFDRSMFQKDFKSPSYMRNYITDQSNYENLIAQYEARDASKPFFVFNVTMQNHSAYNVPWKNLPKTVWLTDELQGKFSTVDQYLSLMKQSDLALEYLIHYFAQVEEPTMVVLFGDHQPQVATNFYTQMLGGQFEDLDAATQQKRQAVPFLIWTNYDIQEETGVETSINYLSTLMMETANLPLTGYQQFLSRLRPLVPAVNAVGIMDEEGSWTHSESDLTEDAGAMLEAYKMLQYNQLFDDEENRLQNFFTLK
ncbi:MAG: LTA synthase family protein [Clostridia bacterium]|nr:LTA synthase family protein [Clostridia bacterium]